MTASWEPNMNPGLPMNNPTVLVVEDDDVQLEAIQENFGRQNIPCDLVKTGEEAIELLQRENYGAIVLDLDLPDCDGAFSKRNPPCSLRMPSLPTRH